MSVSMTQEIKKCVCSHDMMEKDDSKVEMSKISGIIRRMPTAVVLALLTVGMADLISGYVYLTGFFSILNDVLDFLIMFLLFSILLWLYKNSINKEVRTRNNGYGGEKKIERSKEGKIHGK